MIEVYQGSAHKIHERVEGLVQFGFCSPPYFRQKQYEGIQVVDWDEISITDPFTMEEIVIPAQSVALGQEVKALDFVAHLVECFRSFRKILSPDGLLVVNLADKYIGKPGNGRGGGEKFEGKIPEYSSGDSTNAGKGFKTKDLALIPQRFALAMWADGWHMVQAIPWLKQNGMPEGNLKRRLTRAHEHIYIFANKSSHYFNPDEIRVWQGEFKSRLCRTSDIWELGVNESILLLQQEIEYLRGAMRNGMDLDIAGIVTGVVTNNTGYKGAHFATFPERLAELFIRACTSGKGACNECGRQYKPNGSLHPKCYHHNKGFSPSRVCDMFGGSGTTGKVAVNMGRRAVVGEISNIYIKEHIENQARCTSGYQD